jgi:hypothetical protein
MLSLIVKPLEFGILPFSHKGINSCANKVWLDAQQRNEHIRAFKIFISAKIKNVKVLFSRNQPYTMPFRQPKDETTKMDGLSH